ncbi:MAG: helix-turn-helix domain-containing protein [Armatimonadota bacterium]|nr:helix-turn-helix domain-containing protein [Armatimonadota bacterium]
MSLLEECGTVRGTVGARRDAAAVTSDQPVPVQPAYTTMQTRARRCSVFQGERSPRGKEEVGRGQRRFRSGNRTDIRYAIMNEELLTAQEAARRLGVSVQYVRRLLRRGAMPGVRVGRVWAVPQAGVDSFRSRTALVPLFPRRGR